MATFIQVKLSDFEEQFSMPHKTKPDQRAFDLITPQGQEAYYVCTLRETNKGKLILKVLTTIKSGSKSARACGKDAIRCFVVWIDNNDWSVVIGKTNRTYRSGGEDSTAGDVVKRCLDKAREAAKEALKLPSCPVCARPMVERKIKIGPKTGETFLGCCGFAKENCKGSK